MDHRKIPEFVAELSNCAYPIQIKRIQFSLKNTINPLTVRKLPKTVFNNRFNPQPQPDMMMGGDSGMFGMGNGNTNGGGGVDMLSAAGSAPFLANVAICGEMMIFNPPPASPEATGELPVPVTADPNAVAPTTPATEATTAPTTEGMTPAGTPPADGSTPTPPVVTPTTPETGSQGVPSATESPAAGMSPEGSPKPETSPAPVTSPVPTTNPQETPTPTAPATNPATGTPPAANP
jgi:hypothetical protein